MADLTQILRYLAGHPDSSSAEVGAALGLQGPTVFSRLKAAEMAGQARRRREHGAAPWLWRACPAGMSLATAHERGDRRCTPTR